MMSVKELKTLLEGENDNDVVVMSSDAEGNKISPLDGIETGYYIPDTTWDGEFRTDIDDDSQAESAILFYPTN